MDERISVLFREVADLPPVQRENVFAARDISPDARKDRTDVYSLGAVLYKMVAGSCTGTPNCRTTGTCNANSR
jgi:hypothetical protein